MAAKPNQDLIYRNVPVFLRSLRTEAGLTQRQLADKLGKHQWWIARSETGSRRIDVAEFIEFCIACGVKPHEALDELAKKRR